MTTKYFRVTGDGWTRFFCVVEGPDRSEYRLDGDHWTPLSRFPILGWQLDGDPYLDDITAAEVPVPFAAKLVAA